MSEAKPLENADLWVKVVGMLQQNWAIVEPTAEGVTLHFITDTGMIFDQISLVRAAEAESALTRNGFRRFQDAPDLQSFLCPPPAPYSRGDHPNGQIYSSGRFWR